MDNTQEIREKPEQSILEKKSRATRIQYNLALLSGITTTLAGIDQLTDDDPVINPINTKNLSGFFKELKLSRAFGIAAVVVGIVTVCVSLLLRHASKEPLPKLVATIKQESKALSKTEDAPLDNHIAKSSFVERFGSQYGKSWER